MGLDVEVENVGDIVEISKYGVMSTPALVIDGKVASYGKLLKPKDIIKIIEKIIK
jgi:protein-disulfide isomerase